LAAALAKRHSPPQGVTRMRYSGADTWGHDSRGGKTRRGPGFDGNSGPGSVCCPTGWAGPKQGA
jgi:hypothetical protein